MLPNKLWFPFFHSKDVSVAELTAQTNPTTYMVKETASVY
ncbi:hypothetical protein A33Q_0820 [Indibacter alkaliphilus LW1]|uniref:Uncharacterized protein n=1 Tax=Indibacter alkaliphilus (strain CCUG 57479 / KCTC 22604 / LW1) TaxID=1189612 RepID=S2DJJ8_INDAL|nr:hypothetical protein A33Q_0820 [Indibacter alkaliphilus LW1]